MTPMTNNSGISLAMAVWLAHDEYDPGTPVPGKDMISATSLLKPTRQIVLTPRVPPEEAIPDISDRIASSFGTAIHDSIENAWRNGYRTAMQRLGYPKGMINKIRINPTDEELTEDMIPVYLEQRYMRELKVNDDFSLMVSGKFDQIINGEVNDTKTTSVYAYINRSKEEDYQIQGSIYRWINPEKVTSDIMRIQHVFTDWQRSQAKINPNYPSSRIVEFTVELMSIRETEAWMRNKVLEILANQHLDEPDVIRCSDKELWKSDPTYKYYADPQKAAEGGRSTKNFPNYPAAASYASKQGKGVVVTVPGEVKACGYCPAYPVCTQKDEYEKSDD